ncbi:MAG TPA: alkaline phosphatase D family protein, partial [Ramlibacter sp.]
TPPLAPATRGLWRGEFCLPPVTLDSLAEGSDVTFAAASCRHPGLGVDTQRIEGSVRRFLNGPLREQVAFATLLGDQIYADATANVAETTEPGERRAQRYRDVWGGEASPRTMELLRKLPVWLLPDDHEYDENLDGIGRPENPQFRPGFEATFAYQWRWHRSQRPHLPAKPGAGVRGFWHDFDIGGLPAFAADTRSERDPRTASSWKEAALVSGDQMAALKAWLVAHRAEPKILCCGSVFGLPEQRILAEPSLARYADDWCGYPASWQELARFIAVEGIRNLVILAGDYHLSAVAELEIRAAGAPPARVVSVVASGWNATLPFANPRPFDHVWDAPVRMPCGCPSVDMWSTARVLSRSQRQFTKLSVVPAGAGWELEVQSHGVGGPESDLLRLAL